MKSRQQLFVIFFMLVASLTGCNLKNDDQYETKNPLSLSVNAKTALLTVPAICSGCTNIIKGAVQHLVYSVEATLEKQDNVRIVYDPAKVTLEEIKAAIEAAGKAVKGVKEI